MLQLSRGWHMRNSVLVRHDREGSDIRTPSSAG
jgi:hypothetical protein